VIPHAEFGRPRAIVIRLPEWRGVAALLESARLGGRLRGVVKEGVWLIWGVVRPSGDVDGEGGTKNGNIGKVRGD